ncbi:MAG: leucyl/phenylalanyl-tRNA--protein transferase [Saprospiraceae bacterium]|nr:leucyl/phenylalanyl-tRNA--protein transferase [Saprospiraceae bacterium]
MLAVGGDLSIERLITAYAHGIFPWYGDDEPIMWWFPDPRCVLYPERIKISRSLRQTLRRKTFTITWNQAFEQVIACCRTVERKEQPSTWIVPEMQHAYCALHRSGYAHSVEVWQEGQLVGGLYGVAMGKLFYGESMFSLQRDASKVALVHMCQRLQALGFRLIDCQQDTPHLRSLGAELMPRETFYAFVRRNLVECLRAGARVDLG